MVTKNNKSIRLCVVFRKLNSETEGDTYPLPNISEFPARTFINLK